MAPVRFWIQRNKNRSMTTRSFLWVLSETIICNSTPSSSEADDKWSKWTLDDVSSVSASSRQPDCSFFSSPSVKDLSYCPSFPWHIRPSTSNTWGAWAHACRKYGAPYGLLRIHYRRTRAIMPRALTSRQIPGLKWVRVTNIAIWRTIWCLFVATWSLINSTLVKSVGK